MSGMVEARGDELREQIRALRRGGRWRELCLVSAVAAFVGARVDAEPSLSELTLAMADEAVPAAGVPVVPRSVASRPPEQPASRSAGEASGDLAESRRERTRARAAPTLRRRCTIAVRGAPASAVAGLEIQVAKKRYAIDKDGTARVELRGSRGLARLSSEVLRGAAVLDEKSCATKSTVLHASWLPARVSFTGLPPQAAVMCVAGCPASYPRGPQLPQAVRPIPLEGRPLRVTFELKAAGFLPRQVSATVRPGRNSVEAELTPRG